MHRDFDLQQVPIMIKEYKRIAESLQNSEIFLILKKVQCEGILEKEMLLASKKHLKLKENSMKTILISSTNLHMVTIDS